MQSVETVIVGGGQAGVSTSYYLQQAGREHILLEAASQAGSAWRSGRWDSFCLNTPNWTIRLPGLTPGGFDPNGYLHRDELVALFENYIADNHLPIQYNTSVSSIEKEDGHYRVETGSETWLARNVVVATGLYQKPKVPGFSSAVPGDIVQLTSSTYRNVDSLPAGAVLVVGSAQSGCQIAEELYRAGRQVYLCVGSAGRVPRRYRDRDIVEWMYLVGFMSRTPDKLPSPKARFAGNPQVSGKDGGHNLNLHQFYRDGVVLLGRLQDIRDGSLYLAPDLKENLARSDQFEANMIKTIDGYIDQNGIYAPEEQLHAMQDAYAAPEIFSLALKPAGITSIIWTLGYDFDFSLVRLPVFDEMGFPVTNRCCTNSSGLYFMGMPFLIDMKSGLLFGVGDDARLVVEQIAQG